MTVPLKYTDRDVREQPELAAEAIRYVRWYQGDFDFLVDAKRYEAANGFLPIGTARGVLNCMRVDARYAMVSDPLPAPLPVPEQRKRARPLRVVEDTREPFDLKTYWNARLLFSGQKGAVVVHALRYQDLAIRYYPEAHRDDGKFWVSHLRSICSTSFSYPRLSRTMPEGKRFCHRCAELLTTDYADYDWGPTTPPDLEGTTCTSTDSASSSASSPASSSACSVYFSST